MRHVKRVKKRARLTWKWLEMRIKRQQTLRESRGLVLDCRFYEQKGYLLNMSV